MNDGRKEGIPNKVQTKYPRALNVAMTGMSTVELSRVAVPRARGGMGCCGARANTRLVRIHGAEELTMAKTKN